MPSDPADVVERHLFIDIRLAGKNRPHSKLWVVRDVAANDVVPISLRPRLCYIGRKQQLHILDTAARQYVGLRRNRKHSPITSGNKELAHPTGRAIRFK